ncbi:transcriptional regulator MraZ [Alginatibacterium sediminis]|uniref:Transcriptional regulator MraZ n=1 Tax=Alginatibacterium sediminis TaxID=2164068 RepID=A0A420E995_9ALTE|nr:division/cell wall cluster transcriptional repressor MraZ [Alginatibacterium sediminis]RKF15893.1 transcriptional regulator MraZ [Alginatibacterium sediminis]
MIRGASSINLDAKGRLTMPTRYRDWLSENCDSRMVFTIDISHSCLLLYPMHEWEEIERKLRRLSSVNASERRLQRLLLGHAVDCELDKNGRLLVPPTLRNHAGLEKHLMLVGQLNKFELWSEENWQAQIQADIAIDDEEQWSTDSLKGFSL